MENETSQPSSLPLCMLKATRVAPVPFIKDSEKGWLRGFKAFKWPDVLPRSRTGSLLVLLDGLCVCVLEYHYESRRWHERVLLFSKVQSRLAGPLL